jgi:hypothetical protein
MASNMAKKNASQYNPSAKYHRLTNVTQDQFIDAQVATSFEFAFQFLFTLSVPSLSALHPRSLVKQ